jgi:hypothetical protein
MGMVDILRGAIIAGDSLKPSWAILIVMDGAEGLNHQSPDGYKEHAVSIRPQRNTKGKLEWPQGKPK